ncbi:hypothetical protein COLO4_29637 [Corchorus olitorius]|uniref:F-box domain-containing protein n=1 Tax=Corchorus olitorius TaxID=93759 RepID=A0A1R3HDT1_9ROSI|nr:hypothetical protein COLO4_29637 [Corchorus olitorius]
MSSAEVIGSNDDIIMEILLHLPVKSLIRFKLVSKNWLSLISNPNFVLLHCRQSPKTVSGFILACFLPRSFKCPPMYMHVSLDENQNQNSNSFQSQANFHFDPCAPGAIIISQSCNGLLLCYSFSRYNSTACVYYVFNPATNEFSILPEPFCNENSINYFSLAYDPTISRFYQVVCLQFSTSSCKIQIYSSKTETWRDAKNQELDYLSANFQHGVYWNGGIHWLFTSDGISFRFDIEQETILHVPRPPLPEDWNPHNLRHFMESQGHLFFINFDSPEYVIYEMEKDCAKWFVKHRLDINLILSAFPDEMDRNRENSSNSVVELEKLISPVSLVEVENEGLLLVMSIPGRFISYRFKDNTFKTIREAGFYFSRRFKWYHTFNYMETLCYV